MAAIRIKPNLAGKYLRALYNHFTDKKEDLKDVIPHKMMEIIETDKRDWSPFKP